jgi:nucleoside-diphosphate-sugar epimerase
MRALVIGGTGPSGPYVVRGLLERGYDVSMLHTGAHELAEIPASVQHIHADPNSRESLEGSIGDSHWDVVCGMYGRLRYAADVLAGRCDRFIGVTSLTGLTPPELGEFPSFREVPITEDRPRMRERLAGYERSFAIAETERRVFAHHAADKFSATILRYTNLYGPRVTRQWLWPLVRRVSDGRRTVIVPGDGTTVPSICYAANAAHQVLLAVERPEAIGQVFNSVDSKTYVLTDIIRLVADELEHELEIVPVSHPVAERLAATYARPSRIVDTAKLKLVLGYADPVAPDLAIRRTVRWLFDHRRQLDEAELDRFAPNPYDYELEDRFIASYREWAAGFE